MTTDRAGAIVWFTGLSGAGKSTIAMAVADELRVADVPVELLDGDVIRENLSKGLGFTKEDRDTNIRRIGFVANLLSRHGVVVLVAAISPYREVRDEVRAATSRGADFVEVYVRCPIAALIDRDVKGLYARALRGEIAHFTGLSDPYEEPLHPELVVDTGSGESARESTLSVLRALEKRGTVPLGEVAPSTSIESAGGNGRIPDPVASGGRA